MPDSTDDRQNHQFNSRRTGRPASATFSSEAVTVADDCRRSANLCVVNGNEYRPTASQVNSEVWLSLLSGAIGIDYFCNDATSSFFCLGDNAGGAAAIETRENLTFVNSHVRQFARQLNARTIGACAMVNMLPSGVIATVPACTNGSLTMQTDQPLVPGLAMAKSYKGAIYLFAMSDRRSSTGAQFTFTLAGAATRTATIVFDFKCELRSGAQYDGQAHQTERPWRLNRCVRLRP